MAGLHTSESIWNEWISFGLVSIAIRLYADTEGKELFSFNQLHGQNQRIQYKKVVVVVAAAQSQSKKSIGASAKANTVSVEEEVLEKE